MRECRIYTWHFIILASVPSAKYNNYNGDNIASQFSYETLNLKTKTFLNTISKDVKSRILKGKAIMSSKPSHKTTKTTSTREFARTNMWFFLVELVLETHYSKSNDAEYDLTTRDKEHVSLVICALPLNETHQVRVSHY